MQRNNNKVSTTEGDPIRLCQNTKGTVSRVPLIKICGITTEREIEWINTLEIDYIGFVFAKSKREVTGNQAAMLRDRLRKGIQAVGVFANLPCPVVNEIAAKCHLDIIQLHGEHGYLNEQSYCRPIWLAIPVKKDILSTLSGLNHSGYYVLDTYQKEKMGGTGQTFDWNLIKGLSEMYRIVLAGGLTVENVKNAIQIVKPDIVDVSTGVEGPDGKKDEMKVKAFIQSVRESGADFA